MKKTTISLLLAAAAMLAAPGCKKTLDVNQNPNALTEVTARQLLSSAEITIAQTYGNYFTIIGGFWAQYWTQNPLASQYKNLDQYSPGPSSANTAWSLLYAGALTDLQTLIDKDESPNYTAVAMLLKAYTFQLLTDNFGDIPYTQALRGKEGISSPSYDSQESVYTGLISMTRAAIALIDEDGAVPENDLIYGGDMGLWRHFGNTLLLRLHMRLSERNPGLAQQGIAALDAEGASFIGEDETAQISYSASAGNDNPLYNESHALGTQNIIASATAIDSFRTRTDPRLAIFYFANATPFRGNRQGAYDTSGVTFAYPGAAVGGLANPTTNALTTANQTAPVKLLSSYESLFLQAEAQARGWMSGSAQATTREAIDANFTEYGITSAATRNRYLDSVAVFPVGGSTADQVRFIITEKYYAMCGNQNIEAWTEWRRTGYPSFFRVSATSVGGNQLPARLPYPETEVTRNSNFPGQKSVFEKVYWDAN